jgi:Cu2+-exporting ATPase
MKTSAIAVHDMLSVFSVDEVEKRIGEVPGVQSVTVNFAAGSATVRYDETQLEVTDIKSSVRQRGLESAAPAADQKSNDDKGDVPSGAAPAATSAVHRGDSAPAQPDSPTSSASAGVPADDNTAVPAAAEPSPAEPSVTPDAAPKDKSAPTAS